MRVAPQPGNSSCGGWKPKLPLHNIQMDLIINGESRQFSAVTTLASLIEQLGMKADRVAVELNREIVSRDKWADTQLAEGDHLEIVHFVGGGLIC